MASPFLENLKKSVDEGDFNSDAAKKIIEIDKQAENPRSGAYDEAVNEAIESGAIKSVSEEELGKLNTEYDEKMQEIQEKDLALQQIRVLNEIDEAILLSIGDMRDFIDTVEENFDKENPNYSTLFEEVEKIKNKYKSIN